MNKFLVYTSNLRENPKSMRDVIRFAEETPKFYITSVELNSHLANVKEGDNIITKKGNSAYVIRAFDKSLENLSTEERDYIDSLTRRYGLKTANISGVSHVIKFETWCKSACAVVVNNSNNSKKTSEKMGNKNSIHNLSARLRERFMPAEAEGVRIATDGNICVETRDGYVAIDAAGNLTSYPVEMVIELPVFVITKPVDQLVEGDVIARGDRYYKITKISDGKLSTLGYNGVGHSVKTITDFALGATERVVVSLAGNLGGGTINPMMLLFLNGDHEGGRKSSFDKLLPLMMMSQNAGAVTANPWMLAMLAGDKDGGNGFDMKDLFLMSALGGGNIFGGATATPAANPFGAGLFGNLFGGAAPAAAPVATAKKPVARKKAEKKSAAKAAEAPVK